MQLKPNQIVLMVALLSVIAAYARLRFSIYRNTKKNVAAGLLEGLFSIPLQASSMCVAVILFAFLIGSFYKRN